MIIEQTIEIPADYRLFLELPRSVPIGVKARVEVNIPAVTTKNQAHSVHLNTKIEDVRLLLQKEMVEKGTSAVTAAAGDGWEAHVREHYAQS